MNPLHFGSTSQPLYGVYHPPSGKSQQQRAVLLCPPIGHEHLQSYWALKQLANRLSKLGFPVLRFDYFGTGNSSGATVEGKLSRWHDDIGLAINELYRLSGKSEYVLIGLRIGATLAWQASQHLQTETLILWDPIISGKQFFATISRLHQEKLGLMHRVSESDLSSQGFDRLGYLYSKQLVDELTQLDLAKEKIANCQNLIVLFDKANEEHRQWLAQFNSKEIPHQAIVIEDVINWNNIDSMEAAILPSQSSQKICSLLRERSQ